VTRGSVLRYVTEAESPKTTQKCAGSGRSGANLWRPPSAMVFRPTAQSSGTAPRDPCALSGAGAFDGRASHGATADGTADRDACATRHGVVSVVVCSHRRRAQRTRRRKTQSVRASVPPGLVTSRPVAGRRRVADIEGTLAVAGESGSELVDRYLQLGQRDVLVRIQNAVGPTAGGLYPSASG